MSKKKRPWEDSDSDDESDDEASSLALSLWLSQAKRKALWAHAIPPPTSAAAIDPNDPVWSASARGVVIQDAGGQKGRGAFTARVIESGELIGVYEGEKLSALDYLKRHGGLLGPLDDDEVAQKERREHRMTELGLGDNHGSYCFSLLPATSEVEAAALTAHGLGDNDVDDDHVAYIDGEDPALSSWCRYLNHAPHGDPACNTVAKVDAHKGLVWFEATQTIAKGIELCFDYGTAYPTTEFNAVTVAVAS